MSLISVSYFANDDLDIPQGTYSTLANYITKFETEYIKRVLGYDLYKLIAAYDESTSPQVIKDIVEGKEYDYDTNHKVNWEGLIRSAAPYDSPIAYYVYCKYMMYNHSLLLPVGVAIPEQENASQFNPNYKLAWMWHELRELTGYPGQDVLVPSLYNFMAFYIANYDETPYYWEFRDIGKLNMLGI